MEVLFLVLRGTELNRTQKEDEIVSGDELKSLKLDWLWPGGRIGLGRYSAYPLPCPDPLVLVY